MRQPRMERFGGHPIRVSGMPTGFIAGGGWKGCTRRLDRAVIQAGQGLAKGLKCQVQVRFNSDRRRGGAWLHDDLPGIDGNTQIGISAGYVEIRPENLSLKEWETIPSGKRRKQFFVESRIRREFLKKPELVNEPVGEPDAWHTRSHRSIETALTWVLKAIDQVKMRRWLRKARRKARENSL